jgi:hypothetical protein
MKIYPLICALLISQVAVAAVPDSSDYKRDTQSTYNKDATNEIFNFANAINCFIKSMAPEQMIRLSREPYLARIDALKCDDPESSNSGGSTATNVRYNDAWVVPSVDAEGALNVKAYIFGPSWNGVTEYIQLALKIRNGVPEAPPNGQWRLDFCASLTKPSTNGLGSCDFGLGFADVDTGRLTIYGQESRSSAAFDSGLIDFTAPKTGTGFTRSRNSLGTSTQDIRIAFNPNRYLVSTKQNGVQQPNVCFDPSRENPNVLFSVWNNFLYDSTTGQKINRPNQGFTIKSASDTGDSSGFASYNGVNFWDDVPAADKRPGSKVTGNGKTYTVGVAEGFLEKITRTNIALSTLNGITLKINFYGNLVNGRTPSANLYDTVFRAEEGRAPSTIPSQLTFIGRYNNDTGRFEITGYQTCTPNCTDTILATTQSFPVSTLVGNLYQASGFWAWQDGTGTNFSGPLANNGVAVTGTALVRRELKQRVNSSDAAITRLSCVGWQCPYFDGTRRQLNQASSYPFQARDIKTFAWNAVDLVPQYVVGDSLGEGGSVINSPVEAFKDNPQVAQNTNFELYPTDKLSQLRCTVGGVAGYCNNSDSYTGEYYRWNTNSAWTTNTFLRDDSNGGRIVSFDPPLTFTYVVPANPPPGVDRRYAGKKIVLQSPGQGQIWFPSRCISVATGATIDCRTDDSSKAWISDVYVPTVDGPEGKVTLLDANGNETSTQYLVKWTNRGAVLARADSCPNLTLPEISDALPTIAGWRDPTNPNSPNYLGTTWVEVPPGTLPKVIDGVVQP